MCFFRQQCVPTPRNVNDYIVQTVLMNSARVLDLQDSAITQRVSCSDFTLKWIQDAFFLQTRRYTNYSTPIEHLLKNIGNQMLLTQRPERFLRYFHLIRFYSLSCCTPNSAVPWDLGIIFFKGAQTLVLLQSFKRRYLCKVVNKVLPF